jgi:hypothetical protein
MDSSPFDDSCIGTYTLAYVVGGSGRINSYVLVTFMMTSAVIYTIASLVFMCVTKASFAPLEYEGNVIHQTSLDALEEGELGHPSSGRFGSTLNSHHRPELPHNANQGFDRWLDRTIAVEMASTASDKRLDVPNHNGMSLIGPASTTVQTGVPNAASHDIDSHSEDLAAASMRPPLSSVDIMTIRFAQLVNAPSPVPQHLVSTSAS